MSTALSGCLLKAKALSTLLHELDGKRRIFKEKKALCSTTLQHTFTLQRTSHIETHETAETDARSYVGGINRIIKFWWQNNFSQRVNCNKEGQSADITMN